MLKTLTPTEAAQVPMSDRKLILRSLQPGSTQDYMIHATRKEHVKLVFTSAEEGGILKKLHLCPLMIDLFSALPGRHRTHTQARCASILLLG